MADFPKIKLRARLENNGVGNKKKGSKRLEIQKDSQGIGRNAGTCLKNKKRSQKPNI
jgi:hypothetical protein